MIYLNEEINAIQVQNIRLMMKQVQQMIQTEKSEKANIDTIIRLLKKILESARQDIQDEIEWKNTTVGSIHDYLCWWCYFILLDRCGVHTVKTEAFSDLEIEKNGEISSLFLSEYFEKKADFLGKKFEISRKEFDYMFVKQAYRICARI